MAEDSHLTDEMRAMIGKESAPETYEVDKTGVRMFARAVGYTDRVFYDEEYAKSEGYRSLPAPPGFFGMAVFEPGVTDRTSSRRRIAGFQSPFTRNLNGGNEYEYHGTICAGDVLTMTEKITDIKERGGRMGAMIIVTRERTYRNQDGQVVLVARNIGISY